VANPEFFYEQFVPYVWQNLWGNQDLGYKLANEGYPVVLCNVTNLYFDLAYNKDPKEPGLYWGGFVDTRKAYEFAPHDVFISTNIDPYGTPFSLADFRRNKVQLSPDKRVNIYGIQAQLWSETVKGQDMMEYALFPKLLALAERAWSQQPEWSILENENERAGSLQSDWSVFAHTLGHRELPRLTYMFDSVNFRIPQPGAIIEKGQLKANIAFPGLTIRYTTDGSEPTTESMEYTEAVAVKGSIKLRAFDKKGRGGRVIQIQ
jgi:hexosaminidase